MALRRLYCCPRRFMISPRTTKFAAMRGVGAMIVVVILQDRTCERLGRETGGDVLHEEGIDSPWVYAGPCATAPADDFSDSCENGGAEEPP